MKCPHCGGSNIQTIINNTTTQKDFDGCLACIGVILFNWIGLLCGLCGSGTKTRTHQINICQDCGKRF